LGAKITDMTEQPGPSMARGYGFRCPGCKYDWVTWMKPSIVFVSLAFVTDRCPNCQRKHVRACRVEARA
jgi:hypothetical protein